MALLEVLAKTPTHTCVFLSGLVQGPAVEGYYTEGIKALDATHVVIVNLTTNHIQIDNLVFETTRAYDFRSKVCMQNTRRGGSISIPSHPHAHWRTRLSNFVELPLTESDVLHVAFIDKPPSDEMGGAPVNIDVLASDPKKKLVVIQDDAYSICRGPEGLKKSRLDFDVVSSTFVSSKEAIFDVSPVGAMSTPLTYANILFGSFKPPPAQVGSVFDFSLILPGISSDGASGLVEFNDVVRSASFGANKSSLILELCVPHNPEKKWEVLLIVPTVAEERGVQPGLLQDAPLAEDGARRERDDRLPDFSSLTDSAQVVVTDSRSTHRAKIVDKILEVHRLKAEDNRADLVKSVFEMMCDKDTAAGCKTHDLMHTLWNKTIQIGTIEWQQAQSQVTMPCLPRRSNIAFSNALRMHSVPANE